MARSHSTTLSYQDEEQKSVSSSPKLIDYDFNAKNETSGVYILPVLTSIIMDYLGGDIGTEEDKTETVSSSLEKNFFTLFGRTRYELMALKAANLILWGEEKDVEEVITLLKNNPTLLDYVVEVTDPRVRTVKQKVFEIALMAGDVDLKQGIVKEKEKGLVERIIMACGISQARIDEAKQVLLSPEAIKENAKKNQRVMEAVKKFGESIITIQPNEVEIDETIPHEDRISTYRLRCKSVIDQYKADLQSAQSGSIQCGYIFDPNILIMTDQWFRENVARLGGWYSLQSDVFDVNGYGTLQGELSSRDAQVVNAGIGYLAEDGKVPGRSLKNADGSFYFYNMQSRLGFNFIISYYGLQLEAGCLLGPARAGGRSVCSRFESLCRAKKTALKNLHGVELNSYRVLAH